MTHNLTQNRKKNNGDNGAKRFGKYLPPGRKAPESAGNVQTALWSAAHLIPYGSKIWVTALPQILTQIISEQKAEKKS